MNEPTEARFTLDRHEHREIIEAVHTIGQRIFTGQIGSEQEVAEVQKIADMILAARRVSSVPSFADGIKAASQPSPNWNGWRSIDTAPEDCRVIRFAYIDNIYMGAIDNLMHHQCQLDADGIEVGVSRQALCEVLDAVNAAHNPQASSGDDPWNADRLAGRFPAPHFDGETQVPAGQRLTLGQMAAILVGAGMTVERRLRPTHRHKKRGTEYVLVGYGRMQAEKWFAKSYLNADGDEVDEPEQAVDMREVAIYRSATDPTESWVSPREEFEDGRFEVLK